MSDLKTTPIDEGTTVPGHIVALAHGYLAAYGEPVPTDPGSVGGRLPSDLMGLWQDGKDGMTEAVAAWIERHEELSWSDAPWLIDWAVGEYQGTFASREDWAEEEVGRDIDWYNTNYSVSLAEKVGWDAVADEIEDDREVMFVPVDQADQWSDLWVFSGNDTSIERYRTDWLEQRRIDAVMAAIRLEATDESGVSSQAELGEGNKKTVAAIMSVARQLGLVPSACSFTNELRDWVAHAGYVPTNVGAFINGATYRLVTGQQ